MERRCFSFLVLKLWRTKYWCWPRSHISLGLGTTAQYSTKTNSPSAHAGGEFGILTESMAKVLLVEDDPEQIPFGNITGREVVMYIFLSINYA